MVYCWNLDAKNGTFTYFLNENITKIKTLLKLNNYPTSLVNQFINEFKHKIDTPKVLTDNVT